MADPMTPFRWVVIEGPAADSQGPLWRAHANLGYSDAAVVDDPTQRSFSIRLLLQREPPRAAAIQESPSVLFQEPLLLAASVTTTNFDHPRVPPFVEIRNARFTPFPLAENEPGAAAPGRYSELRVAPRSGWPPNKDGFEKFKSGQNTWSFEVAAPTLKATRGRIPVGCAQDAEPLPGDGNDGRHSLTRLLAIEWDLPGDYVRIFGGAYVAKRRTAAALPGKPAPSVAIALDLTPDGVEFDALVPDPFSTAAAVAASDGLALRLRIAPINVDSAPGFQLAIVDQTNPGDNGPNSAFTRLNSGLARLAGGLATAGGPLLLQFDAARKPPFVWPLSQTGNPGTPVWTFDNPAPSIPASSLIPGVRLLEDAVIARLLTRADFDGGERAVAEFTRHDARLAPRKPASEVVLTVESSVTAAAPGKITLAWRGDANPAEVNVSAFDGRIEIEPLAARLAEVWSRSGAIAAGARPPYAFFALDRGWLQAPLPPLPDPKLRKAPPSALESAFRGSLRLAIAHARSDPGDVDDAPTAAGLEIFSASRIRATLRWPSAAFGRPSRVDVDIASPSGALDGALWAAIASPSPTDALPSLSAGPAALESVPILFGVDVESAWKVAVGKVTQDGFDSLTFALDQFAASPRPLLVWQSHPTLALVASTAMTRTAESALKPSATRDLTPAEPRGAELALTFPWPDRRQPAPRLPIIDAATEALSLAGDGRWRWPWPQITAAGQGAAPSSPREAAGVALASLTLPGVEFAPSGDKPPWRLGDLNFSLRFDLPILDELFAKAKPHESSPTTPAAAASPTALDLAALSRAWFDNARQLARARTEADRVVLDETGAAVGLWHPLGGPAAATVRGLLEPYVWKPRNFRFAGAAETADDKLSLGAYLLCDDHDGFDPWLAGPDALGGLHEKVKFQIAGDALRTGGNMAAPGFAFSSFEVDAPAAGGVGAVKHLQDARGLSLAVAPDETAARMTTRAAMLRAAPEDAALTLATLRDTAKAAIGGGCEFWFRDLPLRRLAPARPDGAVFEFDASGGLESGLGPDPAALDRRHLPFALYEWSFFGPPEEVVAIPGKTWARGRYEFDLAGFFAARPLRLGQVALDADGQVRTLEIIVSVGLKTPEAPKDASPFGAEAIYATGNLARLGFAAEAANPTVLKLKSFERYAPAGLAPSNPRLTFLSAALVYLGGHPHPQPTRVAFEFQPAVSPEGRPAMSSATLCARLFGQDVELTATQAKFTANGVEAQFALAPSQGRALDLRSVDFSWANEEDTPKLIVRSGNLALAVGDDPHGPFAFRRSFDDDGLQWLGLRLPGAAADPDSYQENADHERGTIAITLQTALRPGEAVELFRGCYFPAGMLKAAVGAVFATTDGRAPTQGGAAPALASAFAEFAFDAGANPTPQRLVAIRHRHDVDNGGRQRSRLFVDAAFDAPGFEVSAISWPVGRVSVDPPSSATFDPDPTRPADWKVDLVVAAASDQQPRLTLAHRVRPRVTAHAFPLELLSVDNADGRVFLSSAWRFRAVCDHELAPLAGAWPAPAQGGAPPADPLRWTSIDEVALFDLGQLIAAAALTPDRRRDLYAFQARYQDNDKSNVAVAGVARRALADAGFPPEFVRRALAAEFDRLQRDGAKAPASLVLTGAAVTEVVTSGAAPHRNVPEQWRWIDLGVTLTMAWILPWAPLPQNDPDGLTALGPLAHCPQAAANERRFRLARYDAAAGAPHPLDGAPIHGIAVQDGAENLVEERMATLTGVAPAPRVTPVDQSILTPLALDAADFLSWPLYPRTLLALGAVAQAFSDARTAIAFRPRVSVLTVRDTPLGDDGLPATPDRRRVAEEVRFSVAAWPSGAAPPGAKPPPVVTLIVADAAAVRFAALPDEIAAVLTPLGEIDDAAQLADAATRALALTAEPRLILLAAVDPSYVGWRDPKFADAPPPHLSWRFVEAPGPIVAQPRLRRLRKADDTLYPSPTLGWPQRPAAFADQKLAKGHARLGAEEARRNEDVAWAGRVRAASWPAIAWDRSPLSDPELGTIQAPGGPKTVSVEGEYDPGAAGEFRNAAFLAVSQRVALRRAAPPDLRAPPDRLSVLAPPRARAPTVDALAAAFALARIPAPQLADGQPAATNPVAPMLPGAIEFTVTGQRPGVLLTQSEGALFAAPMQPFDRDFTRFGRAAWRAPVTAHQVRAPRSGPLSLNHDDLALRRSTYVAQDERDDQGLRPFKLMKGPAQILRYDDQGSQRSITFTFADPDGGRLTATAAPRIKLIASTPNGSAMDLLGALAGLGLLSTPAPPPARMRAELQVGDFALAFSRVAWGPAAPGAAIGLAFTIEEAGSPQAGPALEQALRDATADTAIRFTIRAGAVLAPPANDTGDGPLDAAAAPVALVQGPPPMLVFDLPSAPAGRRWLDIETFTLAFGDPAYDRELGSPARASQPVNVATANGPRSHMLAVDRVEYDLSATVYFQFWRAEKGAAGGGDIPKAPDGNWTLQLLLDPAVGGDPRQLRIANVAEFATSTPAIPRYEVKGAAPYALALSTLRELADPRSPGEEAVARLAPGDRLQLTVQRTAGEVALTVTIGIVAEPAFPPPAAIYGLATLRAGDRNAVRAALFATSPLPQTIEFPSLSADLVAGHVRRRALFLWPLSATDAPAEEFAFLVKADRTGGAQLPSGRKDFRPYWRAAGPR